MEKVRVFFAFPIERVWTHWVETVQNLFVRSGSMQWKPIEPEDFHLTLLFLGNVNESELDEIIHKGDSIIKGFPPLELNRGLVDTLPENSMANPKVLVQTLVPNLQINELRSQFHSAFSRFKTKKESRKFTPHITLGRIKEVSHPARFHSTMEQALFLNQIEDIPLCLNHLVLYESELLSSGAKYHQIKTFRMG